MSKHPSNNIKGRLLRRGLAGILSLALILGLIPGAILSAHAASWADSYVQTLVDWGVMRGDIGGNMAPERSITRAEFVTMMNRAYGYTKLGGHPFTDVRSRDWYNQDIDIAYNIGYFKGTGPTTASPNASLTREQAAVLLARNMMLQETVGETLGFSDTRTLSDWSRGLIGAAAAGGLIGGYDDGSFQPRRNITRGEVAAMLVRAIGTPIQTPGDHALGNVYGNVTVNTSGVNLRDGVIAGNLYLTGGIDLGDVLLENVTVLGEIVVSGGGESNSSQSSIIMRNVVADSMIVDSIGSQFVTLRAEGNTDIPTTFVRTNAYVDDSSLPGYGLSHITLDGENGALYQLAGSVKEVINKTPGSDMQFVQGTANKVTVDEYATGSSVLVDGDAVVASLNLDTATKVTGTGDIQKLNVGAAGSTVEQLPDNIDIRPGITTDIAGSNMNSTQAAESSSEPKLLAGYPAVRKIAPNSAELVFQTNKTGTIYWAVSAVADGSVSEADLLDPPVYGNKIAASGKVTANAANKEFTAAVSRLTSGGSYYVTAMLVDGRDQHSPIKVTSFSTPDNTTPAFVSPYPRITKNTTEDVQVTVMTNKSCLLYYALFSRGATAPTPNEFKAAALPGNWGYGSQSVTKNTTTPIPVNRVPLSEKTDYVLYLWLVDHDGAKESRVVSVPFTTPDETPPIVTTLTQASQTDRNITLNYTIDEPGSVVWAVVTESEFNSENKTFMTWDHEIGDDSTRGTLKFTDEASALAAKIKLENGSGALKNGASRGNAQTGSFSVTSLLTSETLTSTYYIYYIGKDTAGNYSKDIKYLRINTEDRTPPEFISQTYTPVPDETHTPLASADVVLTFSENIQGGTKGDAMFLNLYNEVERTRKDYRYDTTNTQKKAAYDAARNALGDALSRHFVLWRQPATGEPVEAVVRDRTNDGTSNTTAITDWDVDWRSAQITFVDGQFRITLPTIEETATSKEFSEEKYYSALKLDSGVTYYITVNELYDMAVSPNGLNYQNAQIWGSPRRNLPRFTTMDVQVWISQGDEPMIVNVVGQNTPVNEIIDYHFKVIPRDVDRVEDTLYWDMLIWFNDNVSFTLYSRPIDANGDPIGGETASWRKELATGNDIRGSQPGDPVSIGKDSFRSFVTLYRTEKDATVSNYDRVKNMLKSTTDNSTGERREYAIHLNTLGGIDDRTSWINPNVTLQVSVVAGIRTQLGNLKKGVMKDYQDALTKGVRSIESPTKPYTDTKGFSDRQLPEIMEGTPNITSRTDVSAIITMRLTRLGKVYYMLMPLESFNHPTKGRLDGNELMEADLLDIEGDKYSPRIALANAGGSQPALADIPLINGDTKAVTTRDDPNDPVSTVGGDGLEVSKPTFVDFTSSTNTGNFERLGIIKGVTNETSTIGELLTIDLTRQLKANTAYVLLLLPSGVSTVPDDNSKVVAYRFTTNMMEIPKLELAGINNPTIDASVEDGTSALLSYFVVRYGSEGADFTKDFSGIAKSDYPATSYTRVTSVLDAMTTYVRGSGNAFLGTVFDLYAKDEEKRTYQQLILDSSNPDSSNPTIIGGSGLTPVTLNNSAQLRLGDNPRMQAGTDYTIVAMARRDASSNNYAFCAWHKVQKQSTTPPMITTASVSGVTQKLKDSNDPNSSIGIASARVTLQFDDSLYYWDTNENKGYPIDNCKKAADKHTTNPVGTGNNKCYALGYASSSTSSYITISCADAHTSRNAIRNIVLEIKDLPGNQGDSILFDNYKIVGSTGNGTDPARHSLQVSVRAVNKGTTEAPRYELEVTIDRDWDKT